MKTKAGLLLVACLYLLPLYSQEKKKIYGQLTDGENRPVIGARLYVPEVPTGGITNLNGEYQIQLTKGDYHLIITAVGFESDTIAFSIASEDVEQSVQLKEGNVQLADVEVFAEQITERTSISNISFDPKALETSEGLTEDPLRTLASLPGIGRGGDLFSPSQLYVRGGAPDETLFLLDNNKAYFPYYFGGQKSIFNTDVIENIELLTGGFSAAYGNHLSAVMNVQSRDGSFTDYKGKLAIGFYNSSLSAEGPIVKDKLSFLVPARRTYLDLILKESASFPTPSFGDVTYKFSYKINPKHKLTFSGLSSQESLDFIAADTTPGLPNRMETAGNNHFQSLQLKSSLKSKFYNKLSVTNGLNRNLSEIGANLTFDIKAWQMGVRDDFSWFITNHHKLKAGVEWQYGSLDLNSNFPLDPLKTDPNDTTIVLQQISQASQGEVIRSAYLLYDGRPLKDLNINVGIRADQNPDENYTDFSPRFSANYQLSKKSKIRAATGIFHQFNSYPAATNSLKSSRAIHYILGYEYRFNENIYGWVEAYNKDYSNLVFYDSLQNYDNSGKGNSRGIELLLRKEKGNFQGWISYAFAHSQRTTVLTGEYKDFEFDQRHIVNLVMEYHIKTEKPQYYAPSLILVNFRYADGTPYTPVTGAFNDGTGWRAVEGDPLSARNKDYLNMNIRLEWHIDFHPFFRMKSFFEIWNVFNYKNVQGRAYQYGSQYPNNVKEQQYYASPILFGGGIKLLFGKQN